MTTSGGNQVSQQASSATQLAETEESATGEPRAAQRYNGGGELPPTFATTASDQPSASDLAYSDAAGTSQISRLALRPEGGPLLGEGSFDDPPKGRAQVYKMKVPPDGDPKRVLIEIFRKYYGLNESDVQKLLQTWRIANDDNSTTNAQDMRRTGKNNQGYVTIHVDAEHDGFLRSFKQQRKTAGSSDVETVLAANVSPELRATVQPVLSELVSGDQAARNAAASKLQALIYSGNITGAKAKELREAIDGLLVHFNRGDDQMLAMLRVQLVAAEKPVEIENITETLPKTFDPTKPNADLRSDKMVASEAQSAKARAEIEKIEQEIDRRQDAGTLDRTEAAKLYEMAAFLHEAYTGDRVAAAQARYMARMFRADDAERAQAAKQLATPGKKNPLVNSRLAPGDQPFVRASTPAERELSNLKTTRTDAVAQWSGADNRSKVPETPKATNLDRGTLDPIQAGESRRAGRVDAAGGAIALTSTMMQWYATHQRMNQLADWKQREGELENKITEESTDPVPPRPAELLKVIGDLERQANTFAATDTDKSEDARMWANRLRGTLRAAQAFWDRRQ